MIAYNLRNNEAFKQKVRVAIGMDIVGMSKDIPEVIAFNTWLSQNKSHYVVVQSDINPMHSVLKIAASLVYTTHPKILTTLVFDPVILVDRLFGSSFKDINIIYLYDIYLLGVMPEYDVLKFFSYIKWALTQGVRCIIPINCAYDRDDLGRLFANKRVADNLMKVISDTRYCSRLEV